MAVPVNLVLGQIEIIGQGWAIIDHRMRRGVPSAFDSFSRSGDRKDAARAHSPSKAEIQATHEANCVVDNAHLFVMRPQ